MEEIPDITSIDVAHYLHRFVEWDKLAEIEDMIRNRAPLAEVGFLYAVEEDFAAKKQLKKAIRAMA